MFALLRKQCLCAKIHSIRIHSTPKMSGSKRSRENQKERLQYLAEETAPQDAGCGTITDRAAGSSTPVTAALF